MKNVNLDKNDLINLLVGSSVPYEFMKHPKIKARGSYCGGFVEKWSWNSTLDELNEDELWELYTLIKQGNK